MIDNVIYSIGTCIFKILTCYKLPNQHLLVRTLLLDPEMTDNNLFQHMLLLLFFYLNVTLVEPLKRGHFWVQRMCPCTLEWEVSQLGPWRSLQLLEMAGGVCLWKAFTCGNSLPLEGIRLRAASAYRRHSPGGDASLWNCPPKVGRGGPGCCLLGFPLVRGGRLGECRLQS